MATISGMLSVPILWILIPFNIPWSVNTDDLDMLSDPLRRKIDSTTVPAQFDNLLNHLFAVEFELGFILNKIQFFYLSWYVRQWSFLRGHSLNYILSKV